MAKLLKPRLTKNIRNNKQGSEKGKENYDSIYSFRFARHILHTHTHTHTHKHLFLPDSCCIEELFRHEFRTGERGFRWYSVGQCFTPRKHWLNLAMPSTPIVKSAPQTRCSPWLPQNLYALFTLYSVLGTSLHRCPASGLLFSFTIREPLQRLGRAKRERFYDLFTQILKIGVAPNHLILHPKVLTHIIHSSLQKFCFSCLSFPFHLNCPPHCLQKSPVSGVLTGPFQLTYR